VDSAIRGLSAALMIALGLALGAWLARRQKMSWGLFGIGAATFVASQVAHIPFNSLVLNRALVALGFPETASTGALIGASVLLGLSAGVFEEGARYLMYRYWAKKARSWEEALMIGAGHGGIEAVLLGLLAGYTLLQMLALRGVDLATVVPADQMEVARLQVEAYWATPWHGVFLAVVERAFAICLHLSLSILVLQCFIRRQALWLPLAIGWHALLDAVAVAAGLRLGAYWTEALIGLMALISLGIVFRLRNPAVADAVPPGPAEPPQVLRLADDIPPTQDQLDDSRFSGGAQV
jgi:uncharacterized membrane protein YhfC